MTVVRPTSDVVFNDVPVGQWQVAASAFASQDATGMVLASGTTTSFAVNSGVVAAPSIVMNTTISKVTVTSTATSLYTRKTCTLTAAATDASGNAILVAPSVWKWTSSDAKLATVVGDGHTATATGVDAGSVTITATDAEDAANPKSGTVSLTVERHYKWTVLLYAAGDNTLGDGDKPGQNGALDDLDDLEQLPDNPDVVYVTLMKVLHGFPTSASKEPDARRFIAKHSDQRNAYLSARTPEEGGEAEDLGNLDMAKIANIQEFIAWGKKNYPADHYLMQLWDHGSSWLSDATTTSRGMLYSDVYHDHLNNQDTDDALATDEPFDILFMDACLMQQMEVAYQVRNCCRYFIASQTFEQDDGMPYNTAFAALAANADITAAEICRTMVAAYKAEYEHSSMLFTMSALETSQFAALASATKTYAELLVAKDATLHDKIAAALSGALNFAWMTETIYSFESASDLVELVGQISEQTGDADLIKAGAAVVDAANAAVVANWASPQFAGASGVGCFAPRGNATPYTDTWANCRTAYLQQDWAAASGWADWLDKFWGYTS